MTTVELLFGTKLCPVNSAEMAKIAGVDKSTICRWRKNPDSIPWNKMKILIKARGLSGDEVMKMARER